MPFAVYEGLKNTIFMYVGVFKMHFSNVGITKCTFLVCGGKKHWYGGVTLLVWVVKFCPFFVWGSNFVHILYKTNSGHFRIPESKCCPILEWGSNFGHFCIRGKFLVIFVCGDKSYMLWSLKYH